MEHYDRILCMELFILFLKVISKDIPIAVSAAAEVTTNKQNTCDIE